MKVFRPTSLSVLGIVLSQCALGSGLAAWAGWRIGEERTEHALPTPRAVPLRIEPLYDYPQVVSLEQLDFVLERLKPRLDGPIGSPARTERGPSIGGDAAHSQPAFLPKINHVDHGLRFWGAVSAENRALGEVSESLRRLLSDQREFARLYGAEQAPLLIDSGSGIRVRVGEGPASSSHVDHTLACLAEVGTPLDFVMITDRRATTYRAMLEQSLRDFSLNQHEYEWSALTYVLFLPHVDGWYTNEGQWITWDRLAARLMREQWPRGVCFGNHRLFTLAVFLRVDDWRRAELGSSLLSGAVRQQVVEFLTEATTRLVAHQHPSGFWNADWATQMPGDEPTSADGDRLSDRVLASGHALEWWGVAPKELQPPRETLVRAGQWLVRTVEEMSAEAIDENYTYLSHVGRALALWRGMVPAQRLSAAQ